MASEVRRSLSLLLFLSLVVATTALRLRHCLEPPANTGDLARNLLYGLVVGERGLDWAVVPLARIDPVYAGVSWAELPYNYPVVALFFFTAIAAVWPTILAAKLVLTVIEGANAFLFARLSGNRWLGAAYWAYPCSIWCVSREGQFEPLQNLFALLALTLLRRWPMAAALLLGFAVQTKVTAGLLLPLLLVRVAQRGWRPALGACAAFAASFLPTLVALAYYPTVSLLLHFSTANRFNPYYWNPFDPGIFIWNPPWLIAVNAVASTALLLALVVAAARAKSGRLAFVAPIAFALMVKVVSQVQFWYWLTMPVFLLPIEDRRLRLALLLLLPLIDIYSAAELVVGPFGYLAGGP